MSENFDGTLEVGPATAGAEGAAPSTSLREHRLQQTAAEPRGVGGAFVAAGGMFGRRRRWGHESRRT